MSEVPKATPVNVINGIDNNKLMPFLKERMAESFNKPYSTFDNLQPATDVPVHINTRQNTQEFNYMCKLANGHDANITVSVSNETGVVSIRTSESHIDKGQRIFTPVSEYKDIKDFSAFKEAVDRTGILNPNAQDKFPNLNSAMEAAKSKIYREKPNSIREIDGPSSEFHNAQLDLERIANAKDQLQQSTQHEYFSRDVMSKQRVTAGEILLDVKNPDAHFGQMAVTLTKAGIDLKKDPYKSEFEAYKTDVRGAFEEAKIKTIELDKELKAAGKEGVGKAYEEVIYPPADAKTLGGLKTQGAERMV